MSTSTSAKSLPLTGRAMGAQLPPRSHILIRNALAVLSWMMHYDGACTNINTWPTPFHTTYPPVFIINSLFFRWRFTCYTLCHYDKLLAPAAPPPCPVNHSPTVLQDRFHADFSAQPCPQRTVEAASLLGGVLARLQ